MRSISSFYRVAAVVLLSMHSIFSADIDMSGVWKGTYAVDNGEANAAVTIKKTGDKYSGSIVLTDENITVAIRNASMDDGYFAVWGVIPSKTPDGKTLQAHFTFGGFVDPEEEVWEGNWTVSDKDGNVATGNLFTFGRGKDSGKPPATDDGTITPPKPQPADTIGTDTKPATGSGVSMAGQWRGTYTQTNNQAGTLSLDLREAGGSYAGEGKAVDNDGMEVPPITITSGKMADKRFTAGGSMTVIADDGEQFPASVSLAGDVSDNAWRGTILVKATIEGEETAVISGKFKLERAGGISVPSTGNKSGPSGSGISGGGMTGKGKTTKAGE